MACNRCNLKRIMALFKKQDEARKRAAQAAQNKPVVKEEPEKVEAPVEAVVEVVEVPVVEEKPVEVVEEVKEEASVEEAPAAPAPRRRRTRKPVEETPAEETAEAPVEAVEEPVSAPEEEATPTEEEVVTEDVAE